MSQSGINLWYDHGIEYGDYWEITISEKIKNSQAVILFFTKGILTKTSSYVQREYKIAKIFHRNVYIVMLDRIKEEEIPVEKVAWWVEITEQQCINGYEFTDTAELAEEISSPLGIQNQTRDKKDHETTQDSYEPTEQYRNAAEQGDATAQYNLGNCYYNGNGVPQNDSEAVNWFRKAAEQGHADAQYNLGYCYYDGKGVPQNDSEAVNWFRKAAEQGHAEAQYKLGDCYYYGEGITQNYSEAIKWYKKAAEQGDASAQYHLGDCYYYGDGVTQDQSEAIRWYKKAAEQGHIGAQCELGDHYYFKDDFEAVMWYIKAAEQGSEHAKNALHELGF